MGENALETAVTMRSNDALSFSGIIARAPQPAGSREAITDVPDGAG